MAINSPAAGQLLKSAQQAGELEVLGEEELFLTHSLVRNLVSHPRESGARELCKGGEKRQSEPSPDVGPSLLWDGNPA